MVLFRLNAITGEMILYRFYRMTVKSSFLLPQFLLPNASNTDF